MTTTTDSSKRRSTVLTRSARLANLNNPPDDAQASQASQMAALKRSTGLLNLDEASIGSPGTPKQQAGRPAKRPLSRNASPGNGFTHIATTGFAGTTGTSDHPHGSVYSMKTTPSAPLNPFVQELQQAHKMRKMKSLDCMVGFTAPTPRVADLYRGPYFNNNGQPTPEDERCPSPSPMHPENNSHRLSDKPKMKLNASVAAEVGGGQQDPARTTTPDNYKFVKPFQAAFMSTGLLSKRNRKLSDQRRTAPPDTPYKRPSTPSTPTPGLTGAVSAGGFFASPFTQAHDGQAKRLGLRDSKLRFSVDMKTSPERLEYLATAERERDALGIRIPEFGDDDEDEAMQDVELSGYDLPTTPTKEHFQGMPMPASKRVSEARTIVAHHAHASSTSSTSSSGGHQWIETGSQDSLSDQTSSSPRTPDLYMQQLDEERRRAEEEHRLEEERQKTQMLTSANPQTPAKTPQMVSPFFMPSSGGGGGQDAPPKLDNLLDPVLTERFGKVALVGKGEFAMVYAVGEGAYAVKRTKQALGPKSRRRHMEEVAILKALSGAEDDEFGGKEYVVTLVDAWETNHHLYIMTEYCENGNLDTFLSERGNVSRLDEWRVWKIMVELALGVGFIHRHGYLHLDIKPANVFITFDGSLKIGDFGMATPYPVDSSVEREGDREYIAPEVLSAHRYDTPADMFSLGITMLEIAANIVLPDNGVHWHKLRSGDLTDAGRLSSGDLRHHHDWMPGSDFDLRSDLSGPGSPRLSPHMSPAHSHSHHSYQSPRIPPWAPRFLAQDTGALDRLVRWMLDPEPSQRPSAEQVLATEEASWVEAHRKAGAIIYEGDFGPEPVDDGEVVMSH